jgi:hypothetical protein
MTARTNHAKSNRKRNSFGFELVTHSLPIVFFPMLVLCLYFYVSGTNGLTFPGRSYCFLIPIPTPNPSQHLLLHVVILRPC